MSTPLETVLFELADAADALVAEDAERAAAAVERAARACAPHEPSAPPGEEALASAARLHARCVELAAALGESLSAKAAQSATSARAHGAYTRDASEP